MGTILIAARTETAKASNTRQNSRPGQLLKCLSFYSSLVTDIANQIENRFPGLVSDVNVPIRNAAGELVTDADILLKNAVLQVKSGGGKGLAGQLRRTEAATDLPVIGFGPTLKGSVVKEAGRQGSLITRSIDDLLDVISP